jgi:uncharacterized membrane protein
MKCANVSVAVRINSLKNYGIALVVMFAIALFLICENIISATSEHMKFFLFLKYLSLFFLIFSREKGNRSARKVERREVVKKLDSRFTMYVDLFLLGSMTVSQ